MGGGGGGGGQSEGVVSPYTEERFLKLYQNGIFCTLNVTIRAKLCVVG